MAEKPFLSELETEWREKTIDCGLQHCPEKENSNPLDEKYAIRRSDPFVVPIRAATRDGSRIVGDTEHIRVSLNLLLLSGCLSGVHGKRFLTTLV